MGLLGHVKLKLLDWGVSSTEKSILGGPYLFDQLDFSDDHLTHHSDTRKTGNSNPHPLLLIECRYRMMIKRVDPADFGRDLHQHLLSEVPRSLIRKNLEQGQTHKSSELSNSCTRKALWVKSDHIQPMPPSNLTNGQKTKFYSHFSSCFGQIYLGENMLS